LQPLLALKRVDHLLDVAVDSDLVEQALDLLLVLVLVEENLEHPGSCLGVDVEDEVVDVAPELLVVEQLGHHVFDLVVFVAEEDKRHGVAQLGFRQEVPHFRGVLDVVGLDHSVHLLLVAHLEAALDVLAHYLRLLVLVHDAAQEELQALEVAGALEQLDQFEWTEAVLVGNC